MDAVISLWQALPVPIQILTKIFAIMLPLMLLVAYYTYAERKLIGYMQVRLGPNRVGPKGWLQPIADAVKLMFKEIVLPTGANKLLFLIAPFIAIAPALAAWAVFPFNAGLVLADINAGLLYILALTSLGVYGIIIAGWASNGIRPSSPEVAPSTRSTRTRVDNCDVCPASIRSRVRLAIPAWSATAAWVSCNSTRRPAIRAPSSASTASSVSRSVIFIVVIHCEYAREAGIYRQVLRYVGQ